MPKAAKIAHNCTVQRRWLVRFGSMNMITGESQRDVKPPEWREGPCNVPLFTDAEKASGVCRGCAKGWTHPENFPLQSVTP